MFCADLCRFYNCLTQYISIMNKNKKAKDERRNHIFAEAFDYLKRMQGIKTQQELAEKMGVTPDTVSRILKARTDVTEDAITRLQTASGCIFNLQWLRGESETMLAADVKKKTDDTAEAMSQLPPDMSSLINAIIAAKDDAITSLKRELASKDETISTKDALINTLQQQVSDLRAQLAIQKGLSDGYPYPTGVVEREQRVKKMP